MDHKLHVTAEEYSRINIPEWMIDAIKVAIYRARNMIWPSENY